MKRSVSSLFAGALCFLACLAFAEEKADPETVFHKQIRKKMPELASFRQKGSRAWELLDKDGKKLGMLYLENIEDSQRLKGYAGPVEVALVLNEKDEISGVLVGRNQETPRFLKRVEASGFLNKWNGMTLQKASETEMDTVSRATFSSRAIASGVKKLAASILGEEASPAKTAP